MENKSEDLKVYTNEKLINQDMKLKEKCSLLLEEVKIHIVETESDKAMLQKPVEKDETSKDVLKKLLQCARKMTYTSRILP